MATANAINANSAGLVKYDGAGTFTGVTTTNHDVLIGAASNGITNVAPSATTGIALVSAGAAADPVFGTVSPAGGGTGAVSLTDHGVLVGSGTAAIDALAVGNTGELLVGATGADPAFAASATGNFTFTSATAAATRTLTISNTDNTSGSSTALSQITTGGASSGDPKQTFTVTGATSFSHGIDNSASDAYVISASTALGTTNVMSVATTGEINFPLQPAFFAYLGTQAANVTGDGTDCDLGAQTVALTEVFDANGDFTVGNGAGTAATFTAPVTGHYQISLCVLYQDSSAVAATAILIISSNRNVVFGNYGTSAVGNMPNAVSMLLDMDAGDTAIFRANATGTTKTLDLYGGADSRTFVTGFLQG